MASGEAKKTNRPYSQKAVQSLMDVKIHELIKHKDEKLHRLADILISDDEIVLVTDLISRSMWFDQKKVISAADAIANVISKDWKLASTETALIKADQINKMGSADSALQSVRTALDEANSDFTGANVIGGIKEGAESNRENLVIIDDFSGSGKKISDKINWIRKEEKFRHKIYVATFASQVCSKSKIDPVASEYFSANWLNKAISEHYTNTIASSNINTMQAIEARFGSISTNESLGFGQVEALYFPIGLNTPNSVFPVFWKKNHSSNSNFTPLLSRNAKA